MEDINSTGLTSDENMIELIKLLENNGMKTMSERLVDTISYIEVLQGKIEEMNTEIGNMRHQLDEFQLPKDKSIKDMVKDAYERVYEKARSEIRAGFESAHSKAVELKRGVQAVAAFMIFKSAEIVKDFKDKGRSALSKVTEILKVKPMLEKIQWKIHTGILDTDKTIQRIDYYMENMREAKAMKKNAKRVLQGKTPNEKANYKMPMMEFARKAYYWQKGVYQSAELFTEASIGKIKDMELEVRKVKEPVSPNLATSVAESKSYGADAFEAFEKDMQKGKVDSKLVQMVMEEFEGRGGKAPEVPKAGKR